MITNEEVTLRACLVASRSDWNGYTTYVFKCLDIHDEEHEYIMCKRFPYWDAKELKEGDVGFVKVRYVLEGDEYLKDDVVEKYKHTDIHFLSFVPINENILNTHSGNRINVEDNKVSVQMTNGVKEDLPQTKEKDYEQERDDERDSNAKD